MNVSVSCYGLVRWKINDLTAAYQSGDCPTALREWIPLAKREDVGAKYLAQLDVSFLWVGKRRKSRPKSI